MKNKLIMALYIVFILAIAVALSSRLGHLRRQVAIEDSLVKSMQSTKAQVMESTISAWGRINDQFMTEEQIDAEISAIEEIVKPDKATINITKEDGGDALKHTLHASSGNKYYNISVESIKTEEGGETYAIVDLSIDNSSAELASERQKLEQYFKGRSKNPEISSCIIGIYNGKLEENEMRTKISDALSAVKAKKVEGLETNEVNSISAFSGNINEFVLSNNKKINMQIAMRYSSYDDKTYIWIGSPLIHMEY
jgi:hypothetical protein